MMYRILILTVLAVWLILTLVGIGVVFRGDGEKSLAVPAPETEEPVEVQWQETEPPVPDSMEPTETSVTVPQEEIPLQTETAEFHWKPTEETQPTEPPRQDQPNQTFSLCRNRRLKPNQWRSPSLKNSKRLRIRSQRFRKKQPPD